MKKGKRVDKRGEEEKKKGGSWGKGMRGGERKGEEGVEEKEKGDGGKGRGGGKGEE